MPSTYRNAVLPVISTESRAEITEGRCQDPIAEPRLPTCDPHEPAEEAAF